MCPPSQHGSHKCRLINRLSLGGRFTAVFKPSLHQKGIVTKVNCKVIICKLFFQLLWSDKSRMWWKRTCTQSWKETSRYLHLLDACFHYLQKQMSTMNMKISWFTGWTLCSGTGKRDNYSKKTFSSEKKTWLLNDVEPITWCVRIRLLSCQKLLEGTKTRRLKHAELVCAGNTAIYRQNWSTAHNHLKASIFALGGNWTYLPQY